MTLNQYIKDLKEIIKKNPEHGELEVIYSKDDEGSGFSRVHYSPTLGCFDRGEFIVTGEFDEYGKDESDINAVCLN